jgi:hypothetical protein
MGRSKGEEHERYSRVGVLEGRGKRSKPICGRLTEEDDVRPGFYCGEVHLFQRGVGGTYSWDAVQELAEGLEVQASVTDHQDSAATRIWHDRRGTGGIDD